MTRLSVEEAQAIVDDIRVTNGGLSPEAERGLSQEAKRALRNLQSIAGGSIVHVAQDLYDKDTRFIYELIQNAEDNRYGRARKDKKEPFLHFTLHEDRITVDSNEDGFSESDVRAICSIHRSSKKQTSGYIGHKGIGFKSVFKIASMVTIQSAPFCFFFRHTQGDGGMGMITPYNESHEALPAAVTTRITLHLDSPTDFEARAREFEDIPDTFLLFLRQLRNLTLHVVPRGSKTVYKRLQPSRHRVKLVKQMGHNEHCNLYLFKRTTLTGLSQHPSRPGSDEAEVILAFPVDEDSCPLIQPQYVYSFLPMRREGFNVCSPTPRYRHHANMYSSSSNPTSLPRQIDGASTCAPETRPFVRAYAISLFGRSLKCPLQSQTFASTGYNTFQGRIYMTPSGRNSGK